MIFIFFCYEDVILLIGIENRSRETGRINYDITNSIHITGYLSNGCLCTRPPLATTSFDIEDIRSKFFLAADEDRASKLSLMRSEA